MWSLLGSAKAMMICSRNDRDLLMYVASFRTCPSDCNEDQKARLPQHVSGQTTEESIFLTKGTSPLDCEVKDLIQTQ